MCGCPTGSSEAGMALENYLFLDKRPSLCIHPQIGQSLDACWPWKHGPKWLFTEGNFLYSWRNKSLHAGVGSDTPHHPHRQDGAASQSQQQWPMAVSKRWGVKLKCDEVCGCWKRTTLLELIFGGGAQPLPASGQAGRKWRQQISQLSSHPPVPCQSSPLANSKRKPRTKRPAFRLQPLGTQRKTEKRVDLEKLRYSAHSDT